VGRILKENLPLSSTPEAPTRIVGGGAGAFRSKSTRRFHPFTVCNAGFGWEKATSVWRPLQWSDRSFSRVTRQARTKSTRTDRDANSTDTS